MSIELGNGTNALHDSGPNTTNDVVEQPGASNLVDDPASVSEANEPAATAAATDEDDDDITGAGLEEPAELSAGPELAQPQAEKAKLAAREAMEKLQQAQEELQQAKLEAQKALTQNVEEMNRFLYVSWP